MGPDHLEDRFATDDRRTPQAIQARRLRIVRYAGYLLAGYGAVLKTIVPLIVAPEELSLAWVPVLIIALLLRSSGARARRAAMIVAGSGIVFYLAAAVWMVLHPPSKGSFALFSSTYYGVWAVGYCVAVLSLRPASPSAQSTERS